MVKVVDGWDSGRTVSQIATDIAIRWYARYDYGPGGDAHEVEQHGNSYQGAWSWSMQGTAGQTGAILNPLLQTYGEWNVGHTTDAGYERSGWTMASGLSTGVWYRYEVLLKFLTLSTYRVFGRIYNASETRIQDWGTIPSWGRGVGSYTLSGWYDIGGANENLHYDEDYDSAGDGHHTQFNDFMLGNNGGSGRETRSDAYAFANIKIVDASSISQDDTTWVGAV
jgi:hypothetical protein